MAIRKITDTEMKILEMRTNSDMAYVAAEVADKIAELGLEPGDTVIVDADEWGEVKEKPITSRASALRVQLKKHGSFDVMCRQKRYMFVRAK
jgi:hypothetical protein